MDRLKKIGNVKAYASKDIKTSRVGIGFEKLDRDVFDPENAYDPVAELGVKWVRLQSGWQRTEQQPGVYSFEWLDKIVDNLLRRGLQPWLCLCYGNPLYSERAKKVFGSVGCAPIFTEEERTAWANYVKAVVKHYHGRIEYYEVWNEPDGSWCWKHGPNGKEYGEFVIATSKAVKEADPEAKVIGGCQCCPGYHWTSEVFNTGAGKYMDAYTYHNYNLNEMSHHDFLKGLRYFMKQSNPDMELIQGETGAQTRRCVSGALHGAAWTERKQAKYMARHFMANFSEDVKFASYFSSLDMAEALGGSNDNPNSYKDYAYFGVLGAEFDENGRATGVFRKKPAYRTLQVIASVFREEFTVEDIPLVHYPHSEMSPGMMRLEEHAHEINRVCFRRPNGAMAMAYWRPTELMTTDYEGTCSFQGANLPSPCRLIDLYDGSIYEIPDIIKEEDENRKKYQFHAGRLYELEDGIIERVDNFMAFKFLPIRDYPLLLTFGDFC